MTRCKFYCSSKREFVDYQKQTCYDYEFSVVTTGSDENKTFWKYTPSGKLNVTTVKNDSFIPGKEYYIDITEAVPEENVIKAIIGG